MYGKTPRLPLDVQLADLKVQAVTDTLSLRQHVQHQVVEALKAAQRRMRDVANPHRRHVEFEVGSKVWLSTLHLPVHSGARKLAAKWCGPFTLLARVAEEAWKLDLPS